jgi:hypothetical protein
MRTRVFPATLKLGAFLALAAGSPAMAQTVPISMSPFAGSSSEDSTANTSYPYGESEMMARQMATSVRVGQQKRDLCRQYGCLVIANTSKNYRITEFRVREAGRDGTMRWSENQFRQFGAALAPRKAVYLFKTGKPETCDWPVLFVLSDLRRKKTMTVQMRASLCMSPERDSLVRVNVVRPEVTVGEPEPRT